MQATKEQTISTITKTLNGEKYLYLDLDGIQYDLDGNSLALWLTSCGYNVLSNVDTRSYGLITLDNGVKVSTNGYCSLI